MGGEEARTSQVSDALPDQELGERTVLFGGSYPGGKGCVVEFRFSPCLVRIAKTDLVQKVFAPFPPVIDGRPGACTVAFKGV